VPYLALHGTDPGEQYVDWLHGHLPQAVVEIWPDHGHFPHLVEPARFVERVLTFDAGLG
jgi:pimeloyl-ACP methyl ester carboxylesterase